MRCGCLIFEAERSEGGGEGRSRGIVGYLMLLVMEQGREDIHSPFPWSAMEFVVVLGRDGVAEALNQKGPD
jgi:hypothetical protein